MTVLRLVAWLFRIAARAIVDLRATDREPVKAPLLSASSIRWLKDA